MAFETRDEARPVVGATRARQGRFGRHVFWVLLFGTLLAALALFAAWTWRSGDLARGDPTPNEAATNAADFESTTPGTMGPQAPAQQR